MFVFLYCLHLAPSAPVINPQTPNSATGSSVRVCWSLYSDDTVESYQLSYRPMQDSLPGKDPEGETLLRTHSCSGMAEGPQRLGPCLPSTQKGGGGMHLRIQLLGAVMIQELLRGQDAGR